jgi:hypothetical protein
MCVLSVLQCASEMLRNVQIAVQSIQSIHSIQSSHFNLHFRFHVSVNVSLHFRLHDSVNFSLHCSAYGSVHFSVHFPCAFQSEGEYSDAQFEHYSGSLNCTPKINASIVNCVWVLVSDTRLCVWLCVSL